MAYLINRNPSGRIICIHALLKYLYNRFRENSFSLNDMKYDTDAKFNIHQTCSLLIKLPTVNYKICPYLDNPLSRAKCYLTQSLAEDTQKSKSVSDAFNALEGLGLINRTGTSGAISARGKQFIKHEYADEEMCKIIHEAVLSYGPFIGLLSELTRTDGIVDRYDITLGYPVTNETIKNQNKLIRLSTGSENDTIVRTRSTLILWAITSGFLLPKEIDVPTNKNMWHVEVLPYIKSKKWN